MTILSFQKPFAALVENKTKFQTIRSTGKREYKIGDKLQLYKGPYKSGERIKMHDAVCNSVQPIEIEVRIQYEGSKMRVCLDSQNLTKEEMCNLAIEDGFADVGDFLEYFITKDGKPFEGQLIKWNLEFSILEVGRIYIDGNGAKFKIISHDQMNDCFEGCMVEFSDMDLVGSLEHYNPDGSIFDGQCPPDHNLKYEVAP